MVHRRHESYVGGIDVRDFIAKFVENYVSVPDLVTGLLVMAIGGIATLILRAIWKWIKSLQQDKRKLRSVLQYVTLFIAFTYSGGIGIYIGINRNRTFCVIYGVVLIVYFAVRLSILVKSLIDEPIDSRQDDLPAVIDSNCDSGSNK